MILKALIMNYHCHLSPELLSSCEIKILSLLKNNCLVWVESYSICLSVTDIFIIMSLSFISCSMSERKKERIEFPSFLNLLIHHINAYTHHILLTQSVDGHLGRFHVLPILNNIDVTMSVQISL